MCGCTEKLVTDAQVARRLGVPRERVVELSSRPGFPEPLGTIPASSVSFWRWTDVRDWASRAGIRGAA